MAGKEIDNIFTYHPPFGNQCGKYELLRKEAKALAHIINNCCPESREKSLALTALQQSIMWSNASIAINEKPAEMVYDKMSTATFPGSEW